MASSEAMAAIAITILAARSIVPRHCRVPRVPGAVHHGGHCSGQGCVTLADKETRNGADPWCSLPSRAAAVASCQRIQ